MKKLWSKTRFKDKNNETICIGDILHVSEYPDEFVGGSLDFEGIVEEGDDGDIVVTYIDIGEREEFLLRGFPKRGRELFSESQRYEYWKNQCLGEEPPEEYWKKKVLSNERQRFKLDNSRCIGHV